MSQAKFREIFVEQAHVEFEGKEFDGVGEESVMQLSRNAPETPLGIGTKRCNGGASSLVTATLDARGSASSWG